VFTLLLGGCGSESPDRMALDVYAASSLTEAFGEIERAFETVHPDVDVRVTYAGSQILRLQIEQGAPADVFASANPDHMQALVDGGLVDRAGTFARNELVVIVPLANPAGIESFAELPLAERIVIGTEQVPAGRYAREVLQRASQQLSSDFGPRVLDRVVSQESNVRLARAKVELGEADAAIIYRTDAEASTRVEVVSIPEGIGVEASYVIGEVTDGGSGRDARAWVDFVLSAEGGDVLRRHGFRVE
jgi:molybdate transport system substrate-binding protein